MARAQIQLGQIDEAIDVLRDARETLRPIVEADQLNTTYQYDLGMANRLVAQAFHKKGENAKAIEHVDRAATIFARLRDSNSLRESDKNVLSEVEQEKSTYRASSNQPEVPAESAE